MAIPETDDLKFKCYVCATEQQKEIKFSGNGPDCRDFLRKRNELILNGSCNINIESSTSNTNLDKHIDKDQEGSRWTRYADENSSDSE